MTTDIDEGGVANGLYGDQVAEERPGVLIEVGMKPKSEVGLVGLATSDSVPDFGNAGLIPRPVDRRRPGVW